MTEFEYLLIGLGLVVIFIFYYINAKDSEHTRKLRTIASAVEDLNRQMFQLDKKMNARIIEIANMERGLSGEELVQELEMGITSLSQPMLQRLETLEGIIDQMQNDAERRFQNVEGGLRNVSMPSSVQGMDDEKILSLYKQGVDIETIAKELRLSKPEVEFVLKINQIK